MIKIKSWLAVLLAGATLVGTAACGDNTKGNTDDPKVNVTTRGQGSGFTEKPEDYITVPTLSSVKVSAADVETKLKAQITSLCKGQAYEDYAVVEDAAKLGDSLEIDYEGRAADESVTITEETLSRMKAEGDSVILGTGAFIGDYYDADGNLVTEGFEDQLIGAKANETREITVTFPDSYGTEELKGVRVIFTVTVHSVSRIAIDDEDTVTIGYFFKVPEGSDREAFEELFPAGTFKIDYTAEPDPTQTFAGLFPTAEYREAFYGCGKFDKIERTHTVPDDAGEEYAEYIGQTLEATLWVEITSVIPKWTDEFVNKNTAGVYTTTEAYETYLRQSIIDDMAYNLIMEQSTMDNPPAEEINVLYKQYVAQMVEQKSGSSTEGLSDEEIKALVDEETYTEICESATNSANDAMKERLVQEYLIIILGVTLSDEEYQTALDRSYQNYLANYSFYYTFYGMDFKSAEDMETYYGKSMLELQFMMSKVKSQLHNEVTVE